MAKTFNNKNFTKRDFKCTNIVACVAEKAPNDNYVECDPSVIEHLAKLWKEGNVTYYGYP